MSLNLTNSQKDLIAWIVDEIRNERLPEEFRILWVMGGFELMDYKGDKGAIPRFSSGMLDALENAGLLLFNKNYRSSLSGGVYESFRTCTVLGEAYQAVDNDFEMPAVVPPNQMNIGAVIHSMIGGNVQAVGIAEGSELSQIVNDAEMMQAQIEVLCENLLTEVKDTLGVDDLASYANAVQEIRDHLLSETPNRTGIRRLLNTLALLGDVEGTIGLMARIWPQIYNLLVIAGIKLGEIGL